MYSYITYNKKTGEIIRTLESTAKDVVTKHPTMDTYFCIDCDKEWSKEGIEKGDIIFDTSEGDEFSYYVENPNKKPPYKCPKCSDNLELQSNYEIVSVTAQEMKTISERKIQFVKSEKGRMEITRQAQNIKDYITGSE